MNRKGACAQREEGRFKRRDLRKWEEILVCSGHRCVIGAPTVRCSPEVCALKVVL
jgi:hypothetical protein